LSLSETIKYTEFMKRELSSRQQKAMDYLLKHGKITNREYTSTTK